MFFFSFFTRVVVPIMSDNETAAVSTTDFKVENSVTPLDRTPLVKEHFSVCHLCVQCLLYRHS